MAKEWKGERLETFVFNETTVEHLHRYAIAMELTKGKDVLDIACGEGYGSDLLAINAKSFIGIDIDKLAISNASKKYKRPNLRFREGQTTQIPVTDYSIDVVVSFETIEHTSDHNEMLGEIKRVLKPGGIVIISTPERKNYSEIPGYHNPYHLKELYESELRSLINNHFSHCRFLYQLSSFASIVTSSSREPLRIYEGNFQSVTAVDKIKPVYLIAIASDALVIHVASSIYIGDSIFQTALMEKEKSMKNTFSYRIGHLILSPLKLMRDLFK